MLRWSYVLPRMVLVGLLLLALSFGLGPLLRWSVSAAGARAVGAQVDVARVHPSWWSGRLELGEMQVADPRRPLSNLVQADRAEFQLDWVALLRRRLVVDRGSLHGLRFATARSESGALPGGELEPPSEGPQVDWSETGLGWLEAVGGRVEDQLENDLKSIPLSRELAQRWPEEYRRLETRAGHWAQRIEAVRRAIENPPREPLRQIEFYQRQLAEVDAIRRELPEFHAELQRLQRQVQQDRWSIEEARRHDEQYLRDAIRLDQLDADSLSQFLLGREAAAQLETALGWLERGRQIWNVVGNQPEVNEASGRGRDVVLDRTSQPSLLIRMLEIDGLIHLGDQELPFTGTIEGLTHQAVQYGRPAEAWIRTGGSSPLNLHATVDHTSPDSAQHREHIVVTCPSLPQPPRELGNPGAFAVTVAPGKAELRLDLTLTGNEIDGHVSWVQRQTRLETHLADRYGGRELSQGFQRAADAVEQIETRLNLGGSLGKPTWQVDSTLGRQLADGLRGAVHEEVTRRGAQLSQQLNQQVAQHVNGAQAKLIDRQSQLLRQLDLGRAQLDAFQQRLAGQLKLPAGVFGDRSPLSQPLNQLFRR